MIIQDILVRHSKFAHSNPLIADVLCKV